MVRWAGSGSEGGRELVRGFHEEDAGALERAFAVYGEQLYDYGYALAGDPRAAEDIVHDTFVDALRRAPRMRAPVRLRAWLYGGVRRRALLRTRVRELAWLSGVPGLDEMSGLPIDEARVIVQGALDRISFADQELVLLTLRHGIVGGDLGAVLGEPPHRAAARAGRARRRAETAVAAQLRAHEGRCSGRGPVVVRADNRRPQDQEHARQCAECRKRARVGLPALVTAPAVPAPPDALRHRVMHTGTDPELAGYRADIVAKGGHLTAEGFPRQPDTPSGMGRRWVIAGSGMAVTLASAVVATLVLGPQLGEPPLAWPSGEQPVRSPVEAQAELPGPGGQGPGQGGPAQGVTPSASPTAPDTGHASDDNDPDVPQVTSTDSPEPSDPDAPGEQGDTDGGAPVAAPSPAPEAAPADQPQVTVPETAEQAPVVARLTVGAAEVAIGLGRTSEIPLAAENGPVPFTAVAADDDIQLAQESGVVNPGEPFVLEVTLPAALIRLPGSTEVTIVSGSDGTAHQVEVSWGLSLL
ncbi:DNA-directed RNA polymerase specialized sigma24 family protein [Actinocorallia herbida]|uniref:DNA-directed RNA polymerase specialized sigma24 family protein n=1 Tax=Actinocorallia herbida TaxID=58109 RepID=A0A3N1DAR9_9ACTN|nr:RNA polymerase sigma factor [Actinocorallia herbida]ROO90600.1 DNA-directed RNA polymerase specialized sigma24 family protein [Actinocorallia herbida]